MDIFKCFSVCATLLFALGRGCSGANYNLTAEEAEAVRQLRSIAEKFVPHDYMKTDPFLLRFLQARDLNVERGAEMLRATVKWRKDNNIDTILQEDFSLFDDHFKILHPGVDKEGRPILIFPFGLYDVRKFVLGGKLPQLLRYLDRLLELSMTALRFRLGKSGNFTNGVAIIDLGGFSLRKQACALCLTVIPHMFTTLERHYPGAFNRVFLINTPTVFHPILDLVRPFLSRSTAKAVRVYGFNRDEWVAALLKEINPDQLPTHYGGTMVVDSLASDWRKQHPEYAALIKSTSVK